MRKLVLGVILVLTTAWLSACGRLTESVVPSYESQESYGFVQNVYGQRISWKSELPIRLSLHESVPQEFYSALEDAIQQWEKSVGRPLFQIVSYKVSGPLQPRQDGVNLIYWMNTWDDNRASEQALTSVYWIGAQIKEADIRINAKNFTFYLHQPKTGRDVHLQSLLVHELGHVLGLKHTDTGSSVMATYLAANATRTVISETDIKSIRYEY